MRRPVLVMVTSLVLVGSAVADEGVLEINQVCAVEEGCFAGDDPGFPVTISATGGYHLTSNLQKFQVGIPTIEITGGPVSLDLAGFTTTGSAPVIKATTSVRLTRGRIFVPAAGAAISIVELGSSSSIDQVDITSESAASTWAIVIGDDCRIVDSRISGGDWAGIHAGSHCHISNNLIRGGSQGLAALRVGADSVVEKNRISLTYGSAIAAGLASTISDNVTQGSAVGGYGIFAESNSVVTRNVTADFGYGISCGNSCVVDGNSASNHKVSGIQCGGSCVIRGNTANRNGDPSISSPGPGIRCSGTCSIIGNAANNNGGPGLVDTTGTSAYSGNHFSNNNGGNANPQVISGVDAGGNVCGGDAICP